MDKKLQTIEDLNSKVWYRFIKVIFVLFFGLALFIGNGLNYESYSSSQGYQDREVANCKNNFDKVPFLDQDAFARYIAEVSNSSAKVNEWKNKLSIYAEKSPIEGAYDGVKKSGSNTSIDWEKKINIGHVRDQVCNFENYSYIGDFLKNFLLINFIIIGLLEFLRGAFYYVVLGKFKPAMAFKYIDKILNKKHSTNL